MTRKEFTDTLTSQFKTFGLGLWNFIKIFATLIVGIASLCKYLCGVTERFIKRNTGMAMTIIFALWLSSIILLKVSSRQTEVRQSLVIDSLLMHMDTINKTY